MQKREIRTGEVYGELTVGVPADEEGRYRWNVRCSCGSEHTLSKYSIISHAGKPCRCDRTILRPPGPRTHGCTSMGRPTPEYTCWNSMLDRCTNPKNEKFAYYGGRGVVACERWMRSFEAFLEDMGPRPGPNYTIERNDGTLGYGPDNCRWATRKEQSRNLSFNRHLTVDGETKTVGEWAEITGLGDALYRRLYKGWDADTAVKTPKGVKRLRLQSA